MLPASLSCTEAVQVVSVYSGRYDEAVFAVVKPDLCCWAPHSWLVELTEADGAV